MRYWIWRVIFAVVGVLTTACYVLQEGAGLATALHACIEDAIGFALAITIADMIICDKFKFDWALFLSGMAGTVTSVILMLILN